MTCDPGDLAAVRYVPDLDLAASLRMPAPGCEQSTVWRERDCSRNVGKAVEDSDGPSRIGIGESDATVATGGQDPPVGVEGNREYLRFDRDGWFDSRQPTDFDLDRHLVRAGTRRTGLDPSSDQFDVGRPQGIGRERHTRFHLARNHQVQGALLTVSGHDRGTALAPFFHRVNRFKHEPAHLGVRGMTGDAIARENRRD